MGGLFADVLLGDLHGAVSRMAAAFAFTSGLVMGRHPASVASRLSGDRRPAPICRPVGDAGQREKRSSGSDASAARSRPLSGSLTIFSTP
jgi:hypothetical protein